MKTVKGTSYNTKTNYFEYTINGKEFWVQGELYYNKKKDRFEHTHIGPRGGESLVVWPIEKTYDVVFNDSNDSNSKGIHGTYDECMSWIESNRYDQSTYFGDYKGGTVSIVCDQTEEEVYSESIN